MLAVILSDKYFTNNSPLSYLNKFSLACAYAHYNCMPFLASLSMSCLYICGTNLLTNHVLKIE
jgi:hypothetical protein